MKPLSWSALGCGTIFGLGLAISRMTDPAKVIGFLNVAGGWDPSLAVVLFSAVFVTFAGFRLIETRASRPAFDTTFERPPANRIDVDIIAGSVLFGIGWGLSGYCPGPGIVSLARLAPDAMIFVGCFIAGSAIGNVVRSRRTAATVSVKANQ